MIRKQAGNSRGSPHDQVFRNRRAGFEQCLHPSAAWTGKQGRRSSSQGRCCWPILVPLPSTSSTVGMRWSSVASTMNGEPSRVDDLVVGCQPLVDVAQDTTLVRGMETETGLVEEQHNKWCLSLAVLGEGNVETRPTDRRTRGCSPNLREGETLPEVANSDLEERCLRVLEARSRVEIEFQLYTTTLSRLENSNTSCVIALLAASSSALRAPYSPLAELRCLDTGQLQGGPGPSRSPEVKLSAVTFVSGPPKRVGEHAVLVEIEATEEQGPRRPQRESASTSAHVELSVARASATGSCSGSSERSQSAA